MPVNPTYPGVYVEEIPSGIRSIVGGSTSVTAFLGRTPRGPVDEPVAVGGFSDFERSFGGLWLGSGLGYAVRDFFLNGGDQAVIVRVTHADEVDEGASAASAVLDVDGLGLAAHDPGAWGNVLQVVVTHPTGPPAAALAASLDVEETDLFSLTLREGGEADGGRLEIFETVTAVDGPRRVDFVLNASRLVRPSGDLPTVRPAEGTYTVAAVAEGRDGAPPSLEDYQGDDQAGTGIHALLGADSFNILCIPPPTPDTDVPVALWGLAAAFCRQRRAFLIVDPPAAGTATEIASWATDEAGLTGTAACNAALYFPRIRMLDPLRGDAIGDFAACGAIAGTYARTDGSRGVWKAPAGTAARLAGAVGLSVVLTDDENDRLSAAGVNLLRTLPGIGSVVWGARTLCGAADRRADEYRYVQVRRLALFIEETLHRDTRWAVFEPNGEPLWEQIRASVGAFMHDLFRRGAFRGTSPKDAYFVRCDATTTTQADVDRGLVNIHVGFAPLKPAEFVVITVQARTANA